MNLQSQFFRFDEKIKLSRSDNRLKTLREKDESIRKDVISKFEDSGHSVNSFFLQGSYATVTAIEPIDGDYDIDVGIIINEDSAPENPIDVKMILKTVFEARNLQTPKIKLPCVTAQYYKSGEPKFHLDYPVYKQSHDNLKLAWGKEGSGDNIREWKESDPKGLIKWVKKPCTAWSELQNKQFKRIVRMIKRWRDFKYNSTDKKYVYSIGLTVLLGYTFYPNITTDGDADDLKCLISTLQGMLVSQYFPQKGFDKNGDTQYGIVVLLPIKPWTDIFIKHELTVGTLLWKRLNHLKEELVKVMNEPKLKTQCQILARVFGDDFPVPEENGNGSDKVFPAAGVASSPQGA